MRWVALVALALVVLSLGLDFQIVFQEDPVAGKRVGVEMSLYEDMMIPYDGFANLESSAGRFDAENPVTFVSGLLETHYLSPSVPGEVIVKVETPFETAISSFVVLPDYEKLEKEYFMMKEFRGRVAVRRKERDEYDPVRVGDTIFEGDTLCVWEDSYAILEDEDGNEIQVFPQTEVVVERVRGGMKLVFRKLEIKRGNVIIRVSHEMGREVYFVTSGSSVTAGVRGTVMGFEVSDGVKVRNFEGSVWIKVAGVYRGLPARRMFELTDKALEKFEEYERRSMERFQKMLGKSVERMKEMAKTLEIFGLGGFIDLDIRKNIKPLDRDLMSFEEIINRLRRGGR